MTRRVRIEADTLAAAVRRAVSGLADCPEDEIDVDIRAPGFDPHRRAEVHLIVDLDVGEGDGRADEGEAYEVPDEGDEETYEAADEGDEETYEAADEGEEETYEAADEGDEEAYETADEGGPPVEEPAGEEEVAVRDDEGDVGEADKGGETDADEGVEIGEAELDEEADAAADFLEGLLDALDLPGDIQIRIHPDHAEVELVEVGSGRLIGRRGQTLEALQELTRCALQRRFGRRPRVMVDIEGYRARRLAKLLERAEEAIDEVLETGEPQRLEPMDAFERKAVHGLVARHEGVTSSSHGREPTRRVVIERE